MVSAPAILPHVNGGGLDESAELLEVCGLGYSYPDGLRALDGLEFEVRQGEILSIVGPSGCGKSTLLSIIAGLKPPSPESAVRWSPTLGREELASGRRPHRRRLTLVFQRDTVLPWKTVEQNVALGLKYVSVNKQESEGRVSSLLRLVRMEDFRKAYPNRLSGGMRRRVALLTGVAPMPYLLLLDEPFAALDEPTRVSVHADLLEIIYRLGLTVILVTHDLGEAVSLSDRILVLTNRPARTACVLETGLGRPRDVHRIRETRAFQVAYAQTWHELWRQGETAPPRAAIQTGLAAWWQRVLGRT